LAATIKPLEQVVETLTRRGMRWRRVGARDYLQSPPEQLAGATQSALVVQEVRQVALEEQT
jgi:hypothetical protein